MNTINSLSDLLEIVDHIHRQGGTVYLRWSRGPQYDTAASMNYVTRQQEVGLSAIAVNGQNQNKREWYEAYPQQWIAMQVISYNFLRTKDEKLRPWICTGSVVGIGGDGEPCITDVEPIAWLDESVVIEAKGVEKLF